MAKIKYHTGNTFRGNKNQISILSDGRNLRAGQFLLYCCIINTIFLRVISNRFWFGWVFLWLKRQAMHKCSSNFHKCQDERWEFQWYLELPSVKYWDVSSVTSPQVTQAERIRINSFNRNQSHQICTWWSALGVWGAMLMQHIYNPIKSDSLVPSHLIKKLRNFEVR